jgi:superfamily II DNA or RNA helicase
MALEPLEYQHEVLRSLEESRSYGSAITVLPSGSGKTYVAAFDVKQSGSKRVLYLVHRIEILEQARNIFAEILDKPISELGIIDGYNKDYLKDIVFATVQTLSKPSSLDKIPRQFDYVIIDEYHHVAAKSYAKILDHIDQKFLLGITATPYRLDGKDIFGYVDNNLIYQLDLETGIKNGILCNFEYYGLWDNVDYSDIEWNGHKYKESDLNRKLLIDSRDKEIIKQFRQLIGLSDRQTLGFCVSVNHAYRMADKFNKEGIKSVAITYETPPNIRRQYIEDFKRKKYQIVFTRDIFNEGVDFPFVEAIMLLRPTVSKTVFFQQIGRGLRKFAGKRDLKVLDLIGNYRNAWYINTWLEEVHPRITHGLSKRNDKPEYHYPVPQVYFDKQVVDLFEYQKSLRGPGVPWSKQECIDEYYRVKSLLGRSPVQADFMTIYSAERRKHFFEQKKSKPYKRNPTVPMDPPIYKIHLSTYCRLWGSWKNFLKSIGEYKFNEEYLVKHYFDIKKNLGASDYLKYRDVKRLKKEGIFKVSPGVYDYVFGNWFKFLKKIKEIPEDWTQYNYRRANIDEKLRDNFFSVMKKTGRLPVYDMMEDRKISKYGASAYRHRFGSWSNTVKHYGFEPVKRQRDKKTGLFKIRKIPKIHAHKYSKQELINLYYEVKKSLRGITPTSTDVKRFLKSRDIFGAIDREFGSWKKLVDLAEGGTFRTVKCRVCNLVETINIGDRKKSGANRYVCKEHQWKRTPKTSRRVRKIK